jgi:hypothetical protein
LLLLIPYVREMGMKSDSGNRGEEEAVVYFHAPWTGVLEKLELIQIVEKFPGFYVTRRLIAVLT